MQVTITLPDTLSATSREVTLATDTKNMPLAIFEAMIPHSFQQLLGDAAASAGKAAWEAAHSGKDYTSEPAQRDWVKANPSAVKAQVMPLMQKRLDALLAGDWTSRVAGVDGTKNLALVRLYRAAMDKATLKRFNALEGDKQVELAAKNVTDENVIAAEMVKIEGERAARKAEAEARKAQVSELAKGMNFDF